jgi:hypothetical protein
MTPFHEESRDQIKEKRKIREISVSHEICRGYEKSPCIDEEQYRFSIYGASKLPY